MRTEMHQRRRLRDVDLRPIEVEITQELSVGAYARRQARRRRLIGLAGALCIVVAGVVTWALMPPTHVSVTQLVRCTNCGYEGLVSLTPGRPPPACPTCKQGACRELWQCQACQTRFVPAASRGVVRCTKCGSDQVGAARP